MKIIKKLITNNDCYKKGEKIKPSMIFVHSTATPGIMAETFANRWNKAGVKKAVHFFVDDKVIVNVLPAELGNCYRSWHCGAAGNDLAVSFEICEPKNLNDKNYFAKAYANAVALAATLCKEFTIPVSSVICHKEGNQMGIASNHADVMHWFPKHGVDMDDFRADVAEVLKSGGALEQPEVPGEKKLYRVQVGAYSKESNAKAMQEKLEADGYDTYLVVTAK